VKSPAALIRLSPGTLSVDKARGLSEEVARDLPRRKRMFIRAGGELAWLPRGGEDEDLAYTRDRAREHNFGAVRRPHWFEVLGTRRVAAGR
jgi:hypothetical protein